MCFIYCRLMAADISGIRLSQSFDLANSANCLLCVRSIPPSPPDVTILEPERERQCDPVPCYPTSLPETARNQSIRIRIRHWEIHYRMCPLGKVNHSTIDPCLQNPRGTYPC